MIDEEKTWSEISKEIARKAIDTVSDLVFKADNNEIDRKQLSVAVGAVYDTISGLVPWDIAELIYNIKKDVDNV